MSMTREKSVDFGSRTRRKKTISAHLGTNNICHTSTRAPPSRTAGQKAVSEGVESGISARYRRPTCTGHIPQYNRPSCRNSTRKTSQHAESLAPPALLPPSSFRLYSIHTGFSKRRTPDTGRETASSEWQKRASGQEVTAQTHIYEFSKILVNRIALWIALL